MASIKMIPELKAFLVKNRIYRKWVRNVRNPGEWKDEDLKEMVFSHFGGGFIWADTPEGHKFWNKYHVKYQTYLNSKS